MQRPLICLAFGAGLAAPVVLAATGAITEQRSAAGGLILKKSLSLTRAAFSGAVRVSASSAPIHATRDRLTRFPYLRLSVDLAAADAGTSGNAAAINDNFPSPAIPLVAPAHAALIDQARFWASEGRDDLAELAVTKLLRIAPDNLQGLEVLARIQVRRQAPEAARKILERMRRQQPDAAEIARIDALMRVDGSDREALQAMRQLARGQRYAQAAAAMRALYPQGPPSEAMTLEYWSLVARAPNGRALARIGLTDLTRGEPGNLRYRLALAELSTSSAPVDRAALAQLIALTEVPAYAKQARAAWRRAMLALDESASSIALLHLYVAQDPNDSAVQARLQQTIVAVEARRKLLADPNYQAQQSGLALLAAGKLDAAAEALQRAYATRSNDIELINGLGLLRLRQRRHADSEALFLRAARLDAGQRARWQKMASVARYWGLLAQAERDIQANHQALAEQHLREARAIDPGQPAASLALAALFDSQRRSIDAARTYRDVLAQDPANRTALNELIRLALRDGHEDQAQALMTKLPAAERQALVVTLNRDRADRLRTQADLRVAQGNRAGVIGLLEQAAALDPVDPWLRLDLARLYIQRNDPGDAARADRLFADLTARPAPDPAALYAAALFDDTRERPLQALATLDRVAATERDVKLTALQRRLWVGVRIRRAQQLALDRQPAAARTLLESAATAIGNDAALAPQVADALVVLGARDVARILFDRVEAAQPQGPDWYLRRAEIVARFADAAELDRALDQAASHGPLTPADAARLAALRTDLLTRRVEALVRSGDPVAAMALLDRQPATPDINRRFQLLRADTALAARRLSGAELIYRALLQRDAQDADAALGLIDTLIATDQTGPARTEIDRLLASRNGSQLLPDQAATFASRLIDLQDDAAALALIDTALTAAPDNTRLLEQAADIAQRSNQPDLAITYLQRALTVRYSRRTMPGVEPGAAVTSAVVSAAPAPAPAPAVLPLQSALQGTEIGPGAGPGSRPDTGYRKLAELLDARSTWIAGAVDTRTRSGATGTSHYRSVELPLEYRQPWREGSRLFMQAIAVDTGAGTLDLADTAAASRFGSVLLCQTLCSVGGVAQHASGLTLAAGIERGDLRADIGTTPVGFPIQNIVGGILKKGDLAKFSYSVDVSRRAVTGSVLSYAGARDPRTGERWGGVLANGVRFGLSRDDGGAFGAWSGLGLHRLTGRNVQANDRVQLMGGGYWRLINDDDRILTVGANAMAWRFSENAGEYTFGHGGYYSPQRFNSLALPVTFGQRTARLSYTVRAALSVSRSATAEAAYYPTRPDLQAQAEALSPANFTDPRYTASTGRGVGRSLAAALEYQVNPKLFLGGWFEIDRSTDYAPNRVLFYFRYNLDRNSARPVTFPPEPLTAASRF